MHPVVRQICCVTAGVAAVLRAGLAAPMPMPDGGLLCHPRPADGDSLPVLAETRDFLLNGHLGSATAARVNGQVLPLTADRRFALRAPWPQDRLLHFELTGPGGPWLWTVPLLSPPLPPSPAEDPVVGPPWMAPVRIRLDGTPLSTAPDASYWILPQGGTEWVADRREGTWLRLPLGNDLAAWVPEARVQRLGLAVEGLPAQRLLGPGGALMQDSSGAVTLSLPITGDSPPLWREELGPGGGNWRLLLPRTTGRLDWIGLDTASGVRQLDWEPHPGGELSLSVALEEGRFGGHAVQWEPGRLMVRFFPRPKGLKGARIVLDPGHGGVESGCVGASGTMEKDLALTFARELQAELERAGAVVRLSRASDSTLSLVSRVAVAREWPADLLLSLHYNSAGPGEDPWRSDGFMTFYWSPWSAEAARRLHDALARRPLVRDRGLAWRSLGVCRHHGCPSLLLEVGSLAQPEEEARLLNPVFRHRQVKALRRALAELFKDPAAR